MYKPLDSAETKKIIFNIKVSSILIQLTYLAFPLSMYIVYNRVIANNNPSAILIVVSFLLIVLVAQLVLKGIETIQKNIIKTDRLIKDHINYIDTQLHNNSNYSQLNTEELSNINKNNSQYIQDQVSKSYFNFLIIYFILMIIIGGMIVIVPIIFLGLNFVIAKALTEKFEAAESIFLRNNNIKSIFIKELFAKSKEIKSFNINRHLIKKHEKIIFDYNKFRSLALYYKNTLLKVSQIINMINIAFILIFGRYLYHIGLIDMQQIIACTLLTVWISRSIGQIFLSLTLYLSKHKKLNDSEIQQDAEIARKLIDSKSKAISQKQFSQIIEQLQSHPIVYWKQNDNIGLNNLQKMLKDSYINIAYANNNFQLFYGSIIDNITLFNNAKYEQAKTLLYNFEVQQLIDNLPYQINYILTGNNDDTLPYDLLLAIILIRELLKKPDLLILDINSDEISLKIKKHLINHVKEHNVKLIIKQNSFDLNKVNHEPRK